MKAESFKELMSGEDSIKKILGRLIGKPIRIAIPDSRNHGQLFYKTGYINEIIDNFLEFEPKFGISEYICIDQIRYFKELEKID